MEVKEDIIQKMKLNYDDFKDMSTNDLKSLISRGKVIKDGDEKAMDEGKLNSHFHLSATDKEALYAASVYERFNGNDPWFDDDEEE